MQHSNPEMDSNRGTASCFTGSSSYPLLPANAALPGTVLGWMLLALIFTDALHRRLPDVLTGGLVVSGFSLTARRDLPVFLEHAIATVVGWAWMMALLLAYRRLRNVDGLGEGDAKLMGAAGAWLGPFGLAPVLLLSTGLAFIWIAIIRIRGETISLDTKIPFGVFLSIAIYGLWLTLPLLDYP